IVGMRVKRLDVREKPSKFMTVFISTIDFFNNMIKDYIGKHWRFVAPLTLTLAVYVLFANVSGLFALDTPTKYTSITFSLSIASFIIVQVTGFVSQSFRYLKGLFEPYAVMFPLNLMSDITPILSMALRLFGNIASGSVMLILIYRFTGWLSPLITPAFHLIFDIGFGIIQMVVLVLLTVIFASIKVSEDDFVKE
ncbi:MAG: F0F1 ATP synthase subunit A, partial [Acholeplasmataceae bacterium]